MKYALLLILFLLSDILSTQAQDRYLNASYLGANGDTVRGFIRYQDTYTQDIEFKTDLKSPSKSLGPNEVKAFTFKNGQTYELVNFADKNAPADPTYAMKIGGDEIKLYINRGGFLMGSDEKSYFVLKKGKLSDSEAAKILYQKNVGATNVLFNDCPDVKEKARQLAVTEERLMDRLEEYHKCKSAPFKRYTPVMSKRIHFGVFAGAGISDLKLSGEEHLKGTSFNKSNKGLFGVMMTFTSSRKPSSIFSLQFELLYTSMFFDGTYHAQRETSGYDLTVNSSTTVKSQLVMPRLGLRFTGRSNIINPYVSVGVSVPNIVTTESVDVATITINESSETTESINSIEIGNASLWVGAGLKKGLRNERALFFDVTFNRMSTNDSGTVILIAPRMGFMF